MANDIFKANNLLQAGDSEIDQTLSEIQKMLGIEI